MSDEQQSAEEPLPRQWPAVVTLKHPLDFGGERITSLTFRRGRLGDMKGLKIERSVSADILIAIASRLSGHPTKVIEMLDVDDAGEVMDVASDFYLKWLAGTTL